MGTSEKAQTTLGSQTVKWSGGGGYSKTGTMYVYQEANAITNTTWTYSSVTVTNHGYADDIPASGGTVYGYGGTGSQTKTPTYTWTSTKTSNGTSVVCSVTCSNYSGVYTGNLRTTETDRTYIGNSTATLTGEGGKTAKCSVSVYQEANIVESSEQYDGPYYQGGVTTYGSITAGSITPTSVSDIPASGGSITFTAGNGSQSYSTTKKEVRYRYRDKYTSGSYGSIYYGSWSTHTPASSGSESVTPDEKTKTISGSNLGTTIKSRTSLGSKTFIWKANGKSTSENTTTVYQQANALTGEYKYEWAGTPSVSYVTANCNGDTLRPTVSAAQYKLPYYTSGETPNATSSQIINVTPSFSNLSVSGTGASVYSTITGAIKWTANSSTSSRDVTVSGKLTANNISTDFSTTASQEGKPAERTFTISFDSDTYDTLSGAMISMVGNNYDYIDSDFTDSEEWYTFTGTPTTIYVDVTNATGSTVKYSVSGAYGCTVSKSYYTCGPTDEGDDNWSFTVTPNGSGDFGFTLNSEIIDVSRTRAVAIDDSTADASVGIEDWSTGSSTWTAKDSDSGEWFTFSIENSHGWYDNIFNWDFVGYPSGTILDSGTEHLGPGEIAEITVSTNSPIGSDTDFNFEVQQD